MAETLLTRRTRLRPPQDADRALWVRLHTDPEQYPFAPWWRATSDAQAEEMFARDLGQWAEHGFGYGVVEDGETGDALGIAGVSPGPGRENLNLYYRFDVTAHGRGLGREVARAVVADAIERRPLLPVTATARPDHLASIRTAQSAGLELVGGADADLPGVPAGVVTGARSRDPESVPASVVLVAPRVDVRREPFDRDTRDVVLDLWCAVTEAGGAVGFLPGAPRGEVAEVLGRHEDAMASGAQVAVLLRGPREELLALGWWAATGSPLLAHRRTAFRVMTDPARRGRNLGRLLMAAMHRVARADGAEIAELGVRGGTGTEGFYAALGYTEVGRLRGGIRLAPGDDRDDITMARHL